MPNGYAIARDGKADPAEQKVLERLPLPARQRGLAAAAERAIQALAANAGIHLTASINPAGGGSSSSHDRLLIIAGGSALIVLAAGLSFWRRRAAPARRRSR
jgi:hypothetical protein